MHQRFHACQGESRGRKAVRDAGEPLPRPPSIPRLLAVGPVWQPWGSVRGTRVPAPNLLEGLPGQLTQAVEAGGWVGVSPTLAFMALWFFLVFFRNCFRLPEETYSVMKITCRRGVRVIAVGAPILRHPSQPSNPFPAPFWFRGLADAASPHPAHQRPPPGDLLASEGLSRSPLS